MSNPIDKFINSYQGYVPNPTLFRSFFNDAIEYAKNKNQPLNMDLRDYFAAKAMQIVGLNWQLCDYGNGDKRMDETPAMLAYAIADAMMEARKK